MLGIKDRAAQGVVDKKLRAVLAGMPPAEAQAFTSAIDAAKHHDDEWIEIDLGAVEVPEEEEEKKEEGAQASP